MHLILAILLIFSSVGQADAQKVKVGFLSGFTGADPNTTNELWKGLTLAIESSSKEKKQIEVVKYDTKGEPALAAQLTAQAIKDGMNVLIGYPNSNEALAGAKVAAGKDVVLITPFASNPAVSQQGDNIIQLYSSDDFNGQILARFTLNDLQPKKILILTDIESVYSAGLSSAYRKGLTSQSVSISEHTYTNNDLKLVELTKVVQNFKPEVVFVSDHIIRASVLIKKIHEIDQAIRFVGGDGLGGKKVFLGVFGEIKDIDLYYSSIWHERLPFAENKLYMNSYKKIYKTTEPTSGAALCWDAARILLTALKQNIDARDSETFLTFIRKTKFETTTGPLQIKNKRENPSRPAVLIGLNRGKYGYLRQIK